MSINQVGLWLRRSIMELILFAIGIIGLAMESVF